MTTAVAPFLLVYGSATSSPSSARTSPRSSCRASCFPTSARATGHGISAGIGKFGAFVGVFLFPVLQDFIGHCAARLLLTMRVSVLGALLTLVLPEPMRPQSPRRSPPSTPPTSPAAPRVIGAA